jgi:hypothetical protein
VHMHQAVLACCNSTASKFLPLLVSPTSKRARAGRGTTASTLAAARASLCLCHERDDAGPPALASALVPGAAPAWLELWRPNAARPRAPACSSAASTASSRSCGWSPNQSSAARMREGQSERARAEVGVAHGARARRSRRSGGDVCCPRKPKVRPERRPHSGSVRSRGGVRQAARVTSVSGDAACGGRPGPERYADQSVDTAARE